MRRRGRLNVDALEQALDAIVARHESLRTTFALDADGSPVQLIAESEPVFM
ncbi:MAG: condensation domain-containing protein, partial [Vicinamibacterales bacterium]